MYTFLSTTLNQGQLVNNTFFKDSVSTLIDDGSGRVKLELSGISEMTYPQELYLVVGQQEPIKLSHTEGYEWVSDSIVDALIDGLEVPVRIYSDSYSIVLLALDLTRTDTGTDGEVVRLCTAAHNVTYDGSEYMAVGDLLKIDELSEEAALITKGTTITLNGIDPSYRQEIDRNAFKFAPIDLLIGVLPIGMNTVTNAQYWHRGTCDSPNTVIDYSAEVEQLVIQVSTNSVFGNLDKTPSLTRCSQSSHEATHNGDKIFSFVASASLGEELWKK